MIYNFGEFVLDDAGHELRHAGEPVAIQPKALELLSHLVRNRERLVAHDEIFEQLWPGEAVTDWSLTFCMKMVRKALRAHDADLGRDAIRTVRGRGYRFVAEVSGSALRSGGAAPTPPRDSPSLASPPPPAPGDVFLGRRDELGRLEALLDAALRGEPHVVAVAGVAGIGKSRLAEHVAERAAERGAQVRKAVCHEGSITPAFWPWVHVLESELAGSGADRLRGAVADADGEESDAARWQLFDAVARLLGTTAGEGGLVLVLDDLQWADESSMALLRFVNRNFDGERVLILLTYRDDEVSGSHPLAATLAGMTRDRAHEVLRLAGLEREEAAELLRARGVRDVPTAILDDLIEGTGGNPLFLRQLAGHLVDEGFVRRDGTWTGRVDDAAAVGLPPAVRELTSQRLRGLSAGCTRVMRAAAVVGTEFAADLLPKVERLSDDTLLDHLDEALEAHVIEEHEERFGVYRFTHPVVRTALYDDASRTRRTLMHLRAGEALESLHGDDPDWVATLANHFARGADAGGGERAVGYCRKAGDLAQARFAYEQAVRHYDESLAMRGRLGAPRDHEWVETMLARGRALLRFDPSQGKAALFEAGGAVDAAKDPQLVARVALAGFHGIGEASTPPEQTERLKLIERALDAVRDDDPPIRARLLGYRALQRLMVNGWSDPTTGALVDEAVEYAEHHDDSTGLLYALSTRLALLHGPDRIQERSALADRLVALARERKVSDEIVAGLWAQAFHRIREGRLTEAEESLEECGRMADEHRLLLTQWSVTMARAAIATMCSPPAAAQEVVAEAQRKGNRIEPDLATRVFGAQTFSLAYLQGHAELLFAPAQFILQQAPGDVGLRATFAAVAAASGRTEQASEVLTDLAKSGFDALDTAGDEWPLSASLIAEACFVTGHGEAGEALHAWMLPWAGCLAVDGGITTCRGALTRYLGLLASAAEDWKTAAAHFESAIEENAALGARPYLTHTRLELARTLERWGRKRDQDRVGALRADARAECDALGLPVLAATIP